MSFDDPFLEMGFQLHEEARLRAWEARHPWLAPISRNRGWIAFGIWLAFIVAALATLINDGIQHGWH